MMIDLTIGLTTHSLLNYLAGAVPSLTPFITPSPTEAPLPAPVPTPWSDGFFTCFWIYTALVIVAVLMYQIGYHRWNPFRKKTLAHEKPWWERTKG